MKKYFFLIIILFTLIALTACAPKVAYQAQESLQDASQEASSQAVKMKKARTSLIRKDKYRMKSDIKRVKETERLFDTKSGIINKDSYRMKGDDKRIKEAERLFDTKSGIVLSY